MKTATAKRIDNGQRFLPEDPKACAVVVWDKDDPLAMCEEPVAWIFHVPPGTLGYCEPHKRETDAFHERYPEWRDAIATRRAWWVKVQ